ncbi:hypothetical protein SRHO_G00147130 [Serrasalmus rhombeus]
MAEADAAFWHLKHCLATEPILRNPDFVILQTDASKQGLWAVVAQDFDGEEHLVLCIRYFSFQVKHRLGALNGNAYALSRLPVYWAVNCTCHGQTLRRGDVTLASPVFPSRQVQRQLSEALAAAVKTQPNTSRLATNEFTTCWLT